MTIEIMGTAKDLRTGTPVIYAKATIGEYLSLIGEDYQNFSIQRRREKHRAYTRMKRDLENGALLPAITLAVKPELVDDLKILVEQKDYEALGVSLSQPNQVNILDGLQRTYILKDLEKEAALFPHDQTLLLEFWFENELTHLIYRIIVLNAGQKPMSMRHQVELLFLTLKNKIEEQIPDLELFLERDATRRRRARKYALDRVALAFQAFLTESPEVKRENIVAQELLESNALDVNENILTEQFNKFMEQLSIYARIDDEVCRIYSREDDDRGIPTGANWFGSDTVMNSFFAAVSQFSNSDKLYERTMIALDKLINELRVADFGDDPLALETLTKLTSGLNPRKTNVGFATRRLITSGFKEFFRDAGDMPIDDCWKLAAE